MAIAEKVGLPNYSNVDVGPAVVERYVEDTPQAIAKALAECALHAEKIVFEEAESVRQRGLSESADTQTNGDVPAPAPQDPLLEAKRIMLAEQIKQLPSEMRNAVKLRLVALGVTNPTTPQAALAVLDAEKVPVLESWLNSLQEDSND